LAGSLFGGIGRLSYTANKYGWRGRFLALFVVAMILACLDAANLLASMEGWEKSGPLLLFLGLLTLLNAPFDIGTLPP
jgi:hypothetical protein